MEDRGRQDGKQRSKEKGLQIAGIVFDCLGLVPLAALLIVVFGFAENWGWILLWMGLFPIIGTPCHLLGIFFAIYACLFHKDRSPLRTALLCLTCLSIILLGLDAAFIIAFCTA